MSHQGVIPVSWIGFDIMTNLFIMLLTCRYFSINISAFAGKKLFPARAMMNTSFWIFLFICASCVSFQIPSPMKSIGKDPAMRKVIFLVNEDKQGIAPEAMTDDGSRAESAVESLERKMSRWEATDEEVKAATLGGITPGGLGGKQRNDGFDIGLYIAFPFMILGSLLFAFFPLIMDNIDVSSVGPPPTV
jgi:hypothetical protein